MQLKKLNLPYPHLFLKMAPKVCSRRHFHILLLLKETKGLTFHVNLLLADDSHRMSRLIFTLKIKITLNLSSAAEDSQEMSPLIFTLKIKITLMYNLLVCLLKFYAD